jgi:hypothetical protein
LVRLFHITEGLGTLAALKTTSQSLRSAPSVRNPLAHTVSECEANDQSDCIFQHCPI